jgi:dephospho-CoA kinase
MLKVGLTGGIGSGKSTIARVFRTLGIPVFEADAAGRDILQHDQDVIRTVLHRFGPGVALEGAIDRAALGRIVFSDAGALQDLNAIIHPVVRRTFMTWAGEQRSHYVLMEAAILAETGGHEALDQVVVVTAPEALRIARVVQRDRVEEAAVRSRLANQVDDARRLAIADHVIQNDDQHLVIPQVLAVHGAILNTGP